VGTQPDDFETLVIPHTASLLRFARRLCQDSAAAEDLVQEALLRGWRNYKQLRAASNHRAWIFRILLNAWHSEGRKRRARPEPVPIHEALPQAGMGVDEATEIQQALTFLPEAQREVLLLAVVEGFTCREIGEMLGVPLGTVMSRLGRARAAMKELTSPKQTEAGTK
jgi:RNA polymerase sigma-70 factor (ECF subfamily)